METATLSETVKLTNEEIGGLQRRTNEILRRIEEGSIELRWVLDEMQRIIEGRKNLPQYHRRAPLLEFVRPSEKDRAKSLSPYDLRLNESLIRLEHPHRTGEHIMAEMWEAENIPGGGLNNGRVPVQAILDMNALTSFDRIPPRDLKIVASTLQWLGTNIGRHFLSRFARAVEVDLV